MSCTTNNKPYFKIGDSFDVPVQMVDSTTSLGVEITPSMSFSCSIVNLLGEVIATPTVTPYPISIKTTPPRYVPIAKTSPVTFNPE